MWTMILVSVSGLQHAEVPKNYILTFESELECQQSIVDEYWIDGSPYIVQEHCYLDKKSKLVYK